MNLDMVGPGKADTEVDDLLRFVSGAGKKQAPVSAAEKTDGYPFAELWAEARDAEAELKTTPSPANIQNTIWKIALARDLQYGSTRRVGLYVSGLHNAVVNLAARYFVQRT